MTLAACSQSPIAASKSLQLVLAHRLVKLQRINADGRLQLLELEVCRRDAAHWVNNWAWTLDPREKISHLPFNLFEKQEQFLEWMAEREVLQEDGLVEKSRDSGLTWLCCAYAVHGWLFRNGFSAGFGSRKEGLVDTLGDADSIFEKMRILLRNLPAWMIPDGFKWKEHDNYCKLINPANDSSITGEAGDEIGRGGRKSLYIVDEHAFLARAKKVEAALSQNTRCIIRVSTPNGPGNEFHTKRFSGNVPVFTFHWRDDPRKGEEWYQREKRRIGDPVIVAQELDIDYTASIEGICIPAAWVRAAVNLKDKVTMNTVPKPVAALDIAEEGKNRSVLGFRRGVVVDDGILDWGQTNTTHTAHRALDECQKRGAVSLAYDAGGGFAGPLKNMAETQKLTFAVRGLNGGESPSETVWPDGRTSKEKFSNARAEWWWLLRQRFEKAYEHVEGQAEHAAEDMVSIPNHSQLIAQLSMPLYQRTETGKIQLERKDQMSRRGVASPDFADMLAYLFAPAVIETGWNSEVLKTLAARHTGK